jgi:acetyl-CoA carboxylase biotin carboxyl carrier protein
MAKADIDADLVRRLAELLEETGLTEIEYAAESWRIRVARQPAVATVLAAPAQTLQAASMAVEPAAELVPDANHPGAVVSPMVGTVYLQPEPGAPHFVKPGDQVKPGQTLLVVEAMKVMNPVTAPRAGRIGRVLVENGAPVEYGAVLMILE